MTSPAPPNKAKRVDNALLSLIAFHHSRGEFVIAAYLRGLL